MNSVKTKLFSLSREDDISKNNSVSKKDDKDKNSLNLDNSDNPKPSVDSKTLKSLSDQVDTIISDTQASRKNGFVSPRRKLPNIDFNSLKSSQSEAIMKNIKSKTMKTEPKTVIINNREREPEKDEIEKNRIITEMGRMKQHHPFINIPENVDDIGVLRQIYENTKEQTHTNNNIFFLRVMMVGIFAILSWSGKVIIGDYMQGLLNIEATLMPFYERIYAEMECDPISFPTIRMKISPMTKLIALVIISTVLYAILGAMMQSEQIKTIFNNLGGFLADGVKSGDLKTICRDLIGQCADRFGLTDILFNTGPKPTGQNEMEDCSVTSILNEINAD